MAQAIDIQNLRRRLEGKQLGYGRPIAVTRSNSIICKVDDSLRRVSPEDYEPKVVAIGPIHRGKEQVKSMEEQKVRIVQELLAELEGLTENKLVKEVEEMALADLGRYFPESVNNGHDFLRTMVLDSCFIIQLLRNYRSKKSGDPILESNKLIQIIHDLLLFENQIPFSVLTALFNNIQTDNPADNLLDLILFLVRDIVPWFDESKAKLLPEPNHLLELVYRCISTKIPPKPNGGKVKKSSAEKETTPEWDIHIKSASELKEIGGIHLKRSEDNRLTFARKVLKLPPFHVSGETEALLRNLMAYEQLQLGDDQPRHVIDYVFFLNCLARSTKDIEMLRCRGIIKNYLGGDEQIQKMIGRLGTHFMRSPDYTYSDVCNSLNNCCSNRSNGLMADLEQTYFDTPGSVIKFLAATLLLVFAAVQVVFAALSYGKKLRA